MARTSDTIDCRPPVRKTPCCPDCGALECLCRPRFFAGQLLSEQDLNRLDQYIKNKNRLHNRNQHGWGVVNGLLVVCDPCGDVKVTQGYAVDPCGDDIVLCEDARVNICELIRKCKQADPQPECQPFRTPPNSNCEDLEEEWVLTVSYREWASRGMTALRGNTCGVGSCSSCGSGGGCTCGSGGSCGSCGGSVSTGSCGCGSAAKTAAYKNGDNRSALKSRGAPAQCEPTVTCEGYNFGVYRKPIEDDSEDDDRLIQLEGAFWDAFICCAQPLMDAIPPMPDIDDSSVAPIQGQAATRWCCKFRDNLLKYFLTHRNTRCEIVDHLRAINCPNPNSNNYSQEFMLVFLQLIAAWAEGLKNCLCLSLLPPPPQNTCDVRVPLATVRVRGRDCKVLSICNWTTERKVMVTWPAMMHWLSIVPIGDFIRGLLDRLCCESLLDIFDNVVDDLPQGDPVPGTTDATGATAMMLDDNVAGLENGSTATKRPFGWGMHLASGSLASRFGFNIDDKMDKFSRLIIGMAGRDGAPLELGALLNAASPRFKVPDNGQTLSAIEAKNLPLVVLSEVMVKPVLASFMGSSRAAKKIDEYRRGLGATEATASDSAPDRPTTIELQRQLSAMQEKLQQQEKQLKDLIKKVGT